MRLLKFDRCGKLSLTKDLIEDIPSYAILSHTWDTDEENEVTFNDLKEGFGPEKAGYAKIRFCGEQARKDGLQHFWVDTCCIDKANHTELSEAITSMFRWYHDSAKCYVYLSDVTANKRAIDETEPKWKSAFQKSRWFTRGWTLQELLAPKFVEFFSREGERLGDKTTLEREIHETTQIPIAALRGGPLADFTVDERMQWGEKRTTKRKEDKAYCLLGLFNVSMSLRYGEGEKAFIRLQEKIDKSSRSDPLKEMDTWIRNECYSLKNLRIERLSGQLLSMDQCYINLAIVRHRHQDAHPLEQGDAAHQSSPFSLFPRLQVKERHEETQVSLSTIFSPRKGPNGHTKQPRRILIRGQAGVGKTTLCKKIVHDFTHHGMWGGLFDRLLWIPLRKLKGQHEGYNIQSLFRDIYFLNHTDRTIFARKLHEAIVNSKYGKTLFVLDGLDEVSLDFRKDGAMFELLLYLLNRPNVIITSRPHGVLPSRLDLPDLELETLGFYPDQVMTYLEKTFPDTQKFKEIQSFLQDHWLIRGLVRIPIQLDAVCLTWDDGNTFRKVPETMSAVYRAIEQKLWKKDLPRLEKIVSGKPLHDADIQRASPSTIESLARGEILLLEILAFTGLHNDVINFDSEFLDMIYASLTCRESVSLPDQVLANVSFLRTSDPSSQDRTQYHFLHLSFQEYFAARYFVRHWKAGQQLECLQLEGESIKKISPILFLQKHKYSTRYNILWRFVAGLLQPKEIDVLQFFKALDEPPDLLGPAHQRLIMHCLSEVTCSNSQRDFGLVREKLEKTLSDWLHFECNFRGRAELARETEFPENVVTSILLNGPEEERALVLESLGRRPGIRLSVATAATSLLEESQSMRSKIAACRALEGYHGQLPKDILKKLAARLEDQDRYVRQAALEVLQGQSSLPDEILARLEHQDWYIRQVALKVLQGQSSLSDEILEKVVTRLEDQDWYVRDDAIEVLRGQSSLPDAILEKVIVQLEHQDWDTRQAALKVLHYQSSLSDETLEKVIGRLEHQDWHVRLVAFQALRGQSSLSNKILEKVVMRLEYQDWDTRQTAFEVLRGQFSLSNEILKKVAARLEHQDQDVRKAALQALQGQPSLSDEILEKVVARLTDEDEYVWQDALEVLKRFFSLPDEILEKVTVRLEDEGVRQAALKVLQNQTSLPDKILEKVIIRLEDQNWYVRHMAIQTIQQSSLSDEIVKKVMIRLKYHDWSTRQAALEALRGQLSLLNEILAKPMVYLEDQDQHVRQATLKVLQGQPLSDEILEQVVVRLEDQGEYVREAALEVLRGQSLSEKILEKVVARLEDRDQYVGQAAIQTLQAFQGQSALSDEILEKVVARLEHQDWGTREAALKILRGQSLSNKILEKVVARLEHQHWAIREAALEVLQGQSLVDETLEKVVARLEHQDHIVREAALKALQGQSSLSEEILLKPQCTELLYKSWLHRSFDEQIYGYLAGYGLSLNTPEGVKMFSFMSEDGLVRFRGRVKDVQSNLHVPKKWDTG
ncbi:uncharacterized protein Z519_05690 [Cladophialophora bantiana CBS 173.52]|uniref:NACHT domain-containing protein n=1 Tax=Cladophialophora bantiana (strain ATCC 10958 / CBS 173.52 / CDC B-1940 / NIH 8579) TaxID=1442370 RepID=A0A0D2HQJ3_CLAB1|nr:uncharacterized protein Z519_05690 [Cladophialophora bantiana CBS 173.52]KIW93085.1 hypothetical protein Z519_05690 [Cladophialophora bantiana CBS 173.52]